MVDQHSLRPFEVLQGTDMQYRTPRKQLNEKAIFFGLSYEDIAGLSVVFAVLVVANNMTFKHPLGGYFALGLSAFLLIFLVPIRLIYRRHILRDLAFFTLTRRRIYAPKHSRKHFYRTQDE